MSNNTNLHPVFAHAFNAAYLSARAYKTEKEQDIYIAQIARADFDTICDDTPNLDPHLYDELVDAINDGTTGRIMLIGDTINVEEHPVIQEIKTTNAEILNLRNKLDKLETHRAALIDQAHTKGIDAQRIAKIENAVE